MTALIVVAAIAVFVLVPLFRQQRWARPRSSTTTGDVSSSWIGDSSSSDWSRGAPPVAAVSAAGDNNDVNQADNHRDRDDRAGESGWGEHGASSSWGEGGGGDSGGGDSGGGDSGGGDSGGGDGGGGSD